MIGSRRLGFTLVELIVVLMLCAILLGIALPAIAGARRDAGVQASLDNLRSLGIAHVVYAMDWNGRQFTAVADDMATFGDVSGHAAYLAYEAHYGRPHPPMQLGWEGGRLFGYYMTWGGNRGMCEPLVFPGGLGHIVGFGAFRMPSVKQFHDYVDGRYYSPTFYAPNDTAVVAVVEPIFDDPSEFNLSSGSTDTYWSSYCFSPAAMFHPDVMRHPLEGGWQDPYSIDHGLEAPDLFQAEYANLKTMIIEHHWNQNAPADPCNPYWTGGTYDGCEPYYFNAALASEPATLFYDLSTRLLPNTEAIAADEMVMQQTGYGLWSRDTLFGDGGYFAEAAYDITGVAHHILTTDGILGRDTIEMARGAMPSPERLQPRPARAASVPHWLTDMKPRSRTRIGAWDPSDGTGPAR